MGVFKRGKFWRGSEDGGFLNGSVVKNPPAIARDEALIPEWGRSLGGGNGNPLQYSCWEGSTDREAWWATVHGVTKILFVTSSNSPLKYTPHTICNSQDMETI